jgi:hypothetical protein
MRPLPNATFWQMVAQALWLSDRTCILVNDPAASFWYLGWQVHAANEAIEPPDR